MSDTQQSSTETSRQQSYPVDEPYDVPSRSRPTAWVGVVLFGGIMMLMVGGFQCTQGLVAIFREDYYLVSPNGLVVEIDYTAWGWAHLLIGLVAVATGIGVMAGQMWARVLGIVIAVVSALVNIAFLAAYPIWSTIIIALDVLVIYALAVHGREAGES
ncbi:DUF7144 family membrane protein [Jidongwangia harbinensis]|uniref:DUF7144 family membrane protein n=1 Tax=Jidongwangia harbinensis TaxID=2878561 RepID=UPI001CDA3E3C|nr:hypothetical protein [Jidongwangia harbinensis]MCA2211480.1 hypothetical protein [Jidongwangia harbinensis]